MNRAERIDRAVARGQMAKFGRTLVYLRGSASTGELTGFVGSQGNQSETSEANINTSNLRDFSLYWDELLINGQAIKPRNGDKIQETLAGQTVTWEVLPTENEDCYVDGDSSRLIVVVHTKRMPGA